MDLLISLANMGFTVTLRYRNVYHFTARHTLYPPIFAWGEHLSTALDDLHVQAVKLVYPRGV